MPKITPLLFMLLVYQSANGENYALIMGGDDYYENNIFVKKMSDVEMRLSKRGFQTRVLFDDSLHPKDWKKFREEVRPRNKGDNDHTMKNFQKWVDSMKGKISSSDQVHLSLFSHGSVVNGKHVAYWRGKGEERLQLTPSVDFLKRLRPLLATGARFHLTFNTCYDGQVLNDIEHLMKDFPGQICVNTSTVSFEEGGVSSSTVVGLDATPKRITALGLFQEYSYTAVTSRREQTSFTRDWMNHLKRIHASGTEINYWGDLNIEGICKMLEFNPTLGREIIAHLNSIVAEVVEPTDASLRWAERVNSVCSWEGQRERLKSIEKRRYEVLSSIGFEELPVSYKDHPIIFRVTEKVNQDGNIDWYVSSSGMVYEYPSGRKPDIIKMVLSDVVKILSEKPLSRKEAEQQSELLAIVSANPIFLSALNQYRIKIEPIDVEIGRRSCNLGEVKKTMKRIVDRIIDQALFEADSQKKLPASQKSDKANRIEACRQFVYPREKN